MQIIDIFLAVCFAMFFGFALIGATVEACIEKSHKREVQRAWNEHKQNLPPEERTWRECICFCVDYSIGKGWEGFAIASKL